MDFNPFLEATWVAGTEENGFVDVARLAASTRTGGGGGGGGVVASAARACAVGAELAVNVVPQPLQNLAVSAFSAAQLAHTLLVEIGPGCATEFGSW